MPRTTVLAVGITAAESSDIVVAAGSSVTLAIFQEATGAYPAYVKFAVEQITPGQRNRVALLDHLARQTLIVGPGTFKISRPAYSGTPFGAFTES